jgi:hypothetical protein
VEERGKLEGRNGRKMIGKKMEDCWKRKKSDKDKGIIFLPVIFLPTSLLPVHLFANNFFAS